jgi:hypothetical protein
MKLAELAAGAALAWIGPASVQDGQQPGGVLEHAKQQATAPAPIDFTKLDRTIARLPELTSEARYGLFLFGQNGEKLVWAALDRTPGAKTYDTLFLDRDADGDLTEKGERFAASAASKGSTFKIGDFVDPGTGATHSGFELTWMPESVRFKMQWRGKQVTMGCYGPEGKTSQGFAESPQAAPVFVPGWDRPFTFEHWMSGTLKPGQSTDFKVFVGNRGDRTGTFSCVDDDFVATADSPIATLICMNTSGKEERYSVKLTSRC